MKYRRYFAQLLLDSGLILCGILGSVFSLITAFSFPVPEGLIWNLVFITVLNCLFLGQKWGKYSALFMFGLLMVFICLIRHELADGFQNLWGELDRIYVKGYDFLFDVLPQGRTSPEKTGGALLFLGIVQSFVCCISVRQWRRSLPVALVLLLGVAPCFVLTDTPPAVLPPLMTAFSLLTLMFSQSSCRRNPHERIKALLVSAVASVALLGLVLTAFPRESYSPPISWDELSQTMANMTAMQKNQGNVRAGLTGNPEKVDLASLGALPNTPMTCLYARTERGGNYYLRGSSYTRFDGEGWQRDTEQSWDLNCAYSELGKPGGIPLSIQNVNEDEILFTTYDVTQLPDGAAAAGDSFLRNGEHQQSYTMLFIPEVSDGLTELAVDSDYEAWVRQSCLEVPEKTREGVLNWWKTHRDPAMAELPPAPEELAPEINIFTDSQSLVDYARGVADCVSRCARYSRVPERVPKQVDFCTWFLNDAETGYCVHYATACTALLRSLGIPARYVTGYVCSLNANENTAVTNLHAHAWVEIRCGGRWFRVEPTPGAATGFTGETSRTEWSSMPQFYPDDAMPLMTEYRNTRRTEPVERPSSGTESKPVQTSRSATGRSFDRTPVWILLGVLALAVLAAGRRALILKLWNRRLHRAEGNERARMLFRRMCRMDQLCGAPIPQRAQQIAQKAGFSQHELQAEELEQLQELYDMECARLTCSGFWKELYAKYLLCLV